MLDSRLLHDPDYLLSTVNMFEGMRLHVRLPCDLWLATVLQHSVLPEVYGALIEYLRAPKDINWPPEVVFPYPGMDDFNEWSLYLWWMKHYRKYLLTHLSVVYVTIHSRLRLRLISNGEQFDSTFTDYINGNVHDSQHDTKPKCG